MPKRGSGGFIITGDARYLEPYGRAVETSPESLDKVRQLVADRADQLSRLGDLKVALRDKLNELDTTILARRNRGFDTAREAIVQADGKATMDRIRDIIARMISTEEELLADRTDTVARDERNVLLIALLAAAASMVTRIVVEFMVHRRRTVVKCLLPDSRRWSAIGELRKLFDEERARYGLRYGPRLALKIARGLYWGRAIAAVLTGGSYGLSNQAESETKNEEKLHSWAWLQRMVERVGAGLITEFIKRNIGL